MKAPVEFHDLDDLAPGWVWKPLQDLCDDPRQDIVDGPFGSNLKASEYVDEGTPIARLQNVSRNQFLDKSIRCVTIEKARELSRHSFSVGDILLTKLGDPLGKACIVPTAIGSGVIVADLVRIRPSVRLVDKRYLTYAINSPAVIRNFERHTKGTTRPRVNLNVVRQLPIPVAPREHQGNVVAEIEKQFSRLDEAVANLQRVKANLKRFTSSILSDAVEGRLVVTEADLARDEGRALEHASEALRCTLAARSAKRNGRDKYREPIAPIGDLAALPNGWCWSTVDQLAEVGTGATPNRSKAVYFEGGNVPWVTSSVVNAPYVDQASEFVTPIALEQTNLTLYPPGTLLVAMYGEGKTRGKCAELRISAATNQALAALQVNAAARPYLKLFLQHNYEATRKVASGGVQPNLNLSLVRAIKVPLPPLAEQRRIVAEVDRRLSIVREVEAEVDANLKRAQALRQAVLQAAFACKLA